jgi:hypothetical protein
LTLDSRGASRGESYPCRNVANFANRLTMDGQDFLVHAGYWHTSSKTRRYEMLYVFFAGLASVKNFLACYNFPDEFAAEFT